MINLYKFSELPQQSKMKAVQDYQKSCEWCHEISFNQAWDCCEDLENVLLYNINGTVMKNTELKYN